MSTLPKRAATCSSTARDSCQRATTLPAPSLTNGTSRPSPTSTSLRPSRSGTPWNRITLPAGSCVTPSGKSECGLAAQVGGRLRLRPATTRATASAPGARPPRAISTSSPSSTRAGSNAKRRARRHDHEQQQEPRAIGAARRPVVEHVGRRLRQHALKMQLRQARATRRCVSAASATARSTSVKARRARAPTLGSARSSVAAISRRRLASVRRACITAKTKAEMPASSSAAPPSARQARAVPRDVRRRDQAQAARAPSPAGGAPLRYLRAKARRQRVERGGGRGASARRSRADAASAPSDGDAERGGRDGDQAVATTACRTRARA